MVESQEKSEKLIFLGEGAYSKVYAIEGKQKAVKIIKKSYQEELVKEIEKNYKREKDFIESMKDKPHPSLVKYENFEESEKELKFYMELCDTNLQKVLNYMQDPKLKSHDPKLKEADFFSFPVVLGIMKNIIEAFQYIRENKPKDKETHIFHRDVKPDNILINIREGKVQAKLADWGFCKHVCEKNTIVSVGYYIYRDPVIENGEGEYDERVDIWSLGLVFFQLLYKGLLPFLNPSDQKLLPREVPWRKATKK